MDGWMDGWVDGWMDGWMGGWMDGWRNELVGKICMETQEKHSLSMAFQILCQTRVE